MLCITDILFNKIGGISWLKQMNLQEAIYKKM